MGNIIIPGNPTCPLCLARMREVIQNKRGKVERFWSCTGVDCMISINIKDPAVNKWDIENPPQCVRCGTPMRVFFRCLDKYMKCQCPKCKKAGKITQVVRETVPNNPKDH